MAERDRIGNYSEHGLPETRLLALDTLDAGLRKHHVMGLVEFDVTLARQLLRGPGWPEGNRPSFTSWAIKCIATAASEQPDVHAVKKGRKVITFEDVDMTVVVEAERRGDIVPRPFVLRKTESKSIEEISDALERQKKKAAPGELVLGDRKTARIARVGLAMPAFIRRRAMRLLSKRPFMVKANIGTVLVTSLGMFGSFTGWALPISMHPLTFAIGSVSKKPGVVGDRVEVREFLHLTILFDHDVVDGGPAARFTARLAELMEGAHGLVSD